MKEKIKKIADSSFLRVLLFAGLANIFQVASFYIQKNTLKLPDSDLALLNWGISLVGFYGVINGSLSRWIILRSSTIEKEKRWNYLVRLSRTSFWIVTSLSILLSAGVVFASDISSTYEYLILALNVLGTILGGIAILPLSYVSVLEDFILIGIAGLISPVLRTVFTVLFITEGTVWPLFVSFVITAVLTILIYIFRVSRSENKRVLKLFGGLFEKIFFIEDNEEDVLGKVKLKTVLPNMFFQFLLMAFYILDGIILKGLLAPESYVVYTTYAFLYKFPLFVSISIMNVLLSRAVVLEDKDSVKKLAKVLFVSLGLIFFAFGVIIGLEGILPEIELSFTLFGKDFIINSILDLIGYTEYVDTSLGVSFGFSWLINTAVYFLFTYLLKTKPESVLEKGLVFLYGVTYILGLLFFNSSLTLLMQVTAGVGTIFAIIAGVLLLAQVKSRN